MSHLNIIEQCHNFEITINELKQELRKSYKRNNDLKLSNDSLQSNNQRLADQLELMNQELEKYIIKEQSFQQKFNDLKLELINCTQQRDIYRSQLKDLQKKLEKSQSYILQLKQNNQTTSQEETYTYSQQDDLKSRLEYHQSNYKKFKELVLRLADSIPYNSIRECFYKIINKINVIEDSNESLTSYLNDQFIQQNILKIKKSLHQPSKSYKPSLILSNSNTPTYQENLLNSTAFQSKISYSHSPQPAELLSELSLKDREQLMAVFTRSKKKAIEFNEI